MGKSPASSEKSPVNIIALAGAQLLDEHANTVQMGTLWQQQTALFIFLRHFGCVSCRAHAADVWNAREKYEKSGARIIFIGNGQPHFIKMFRTELNLGDAPIYSDPTLAVFTAAGFKRGFLAALGPRAIVNGLKMYAQGHKQGTYDPTSGDLWQLGGLLVIKPNGRIAYHYISQVLGDLPPERDGFEVGQSER